MMWPYDSKSCVSSQVLTTSPPTACHKLISICQLDVDDPLVGNVSEFGVVVQAVHVMLLLSFGNGVHLVSTQAVILQLQGE